MGLEANVQISDITVASYTDSDRVRELLIYFWSEKNGEEFRALNAQAFRELFGFNRIKSTYFTINFSANGLELSGRGHGHGVGMCQTGARVMAAAGAKFTDILKRYYPHAELHQPAVIAFERKGTPSNP
ncbi:MAG: hypothetical protein A2Z20_07415 [Bdellovibrionales bacterium RBG_16_40_8]|nr:MAG: hypothetical protein A2Z20_07415 [Bdellovibrionales bacterium RBG_16_40_8]